MRELSQGIPISIHLTTKVEQAGETQDFLFDFFSYLSLQNETL